MITVQQAADALNVTPSRVRQFVVEGKLKDFGTKNRPRFDESEVEELRKARGSGVPRGVHSPRTEAEVAIKAFDLFRAKKPIDAIMKELHVTPAKVRALYAEFLTPLGHQPRKLATFASVDERDTWAEEFDKEVAARRAEADREYQRKMKRITG